MNMKDIIMNTVVLGGGSGGGGGSDKKVYDDVTFIHPPYTDIDPETYEETTQCVVDGGTMQGSAVGDDVVVFGSHYGSFYFVVGTVKTIEQFDDTTEVTIICNSYEEGGISPSGTKNIDLNGQYNVTTQANANVAVQGGDDGTTPRPIDVNDIPSGYTTINNTSIINKLTADSWTVGGLSSGFKIDGSVAVAINDNVAVCGTIQNTQYQFCVYGAVEVLYDYTSYKMIRLRIAGILRGDSPTVTIASNGTYNVKGRNSAVVNVPSQTPTLITKSITQNGTYNAQSDSADGYSSVVVNVPTQVEGNEDAIITRTLSGVYTNNRITKVGKYAFNQMVMLTGINLPNVTVIEERAFSGCLKINSLSLPACNDLYEGVFSSAFDANSNVDITMPALTKMSGNDVFRYSNIRSFSAPLLTNANAGNIFSNCSKLVSINCPELVKVATYWCQNSSLLASVNLPKIDSVQSYMFANCRALTDVSFPAALSIQNSAFLNCSGLTQADFAIANSLMTQVFSGCTSLTALILRKTDAIATLANANTFNNTPIAGGTGYIYVPNALKATYQSATNWSTYSAQFRSLEDYTVDGTTTGALDPTKI